MSKIVVRECETLKNKISLRRLAKTSTERSRESRERKKALKNAASQEFNILSSITSNTKPKTPAERSRDYRAQKRARQNEKNQESNDLTQITVEVEVHPEQENSQPSTSTLLMKQINTSTEPCRMPKTNAEYCRDYRNKRKQNKTKKSPTSSTERVRAFRARKKASLNIKNNISDTHSNDSIAENNENGHIITTNSFVIKIIKSKDNSLRAMAIECTENTESRRDTSSTVPSETQLNLQMSLPVLKQEIVDIEYEGKPHSSDSMFKYDQPVSSEFVNYYDSKDNVLNQIKQELTEEECFQSGVSENGKVVVEFKPDHPVSSEYVNCYESKNDVLNQIKQELIEDEYFQSGDSVNRKMVLEELLTVEDKQEVKSENQKREMLLGIQKENDVVYPCKIKTELAEKHGIVANDGHSSGIYDTLVPPQGNQCKLCSRIFKDSLSLLQHNKEHNKDLEINTMNELHECPYCDVCFDSHDRLLGHVKDTHNADSSKCDINVKHNPLPNRVTSNDMKCVYCNVEFTDKYKLISHVRLCRTGNKLEGTGFKCKFCDGIYKSKYTLTLHMKRCHYDYGRMFECWCGKQFRTPIHLSGHKTSKHGVVRMRKNNKNIEQHKCELCEAVFNRKRNLTQHMLRMHHDYGKSFDCWCGKQFRTPIHLRIHKYRHERNVKNIIKEKLQCDSCLKFFSNKQSLIIHIKRVHYDYGKRFECWCGKQFRTPIHLKVHEKTNHELLKAKDQIGL